MLPLLHVQHKVGILFVFGLFVSFLHTTVIGSHRKYYVLASEDKGKLLISRTNKSYSSTGIYWNGRIISQDS